VNHHDDDRDDREEDDHALPVERWAGHHRVALLRRPEGGPIGMALGLSQDHRAIPEGPGTVEMDVGVRSPAHRQAMLTQAAQRRELPREPPGG
jgi:hypothetical protein